MFDSKSRPLSTEPNSASSIRHRTDRDVGGKPTTKSSGDTEFEFAQSTRHIQNKRSKTIQRLQAETFKPTTSTRGAHHRDLTMTFHTTTSLRRQQNLHAAQSTSSSSPELRTPQDVNLQDVSPETSISQ